MAERIEPAMFKGVFPAPYQPITVSTAFIKSPPTAVLPTVVIMVIVFPAVVISVIVFPVVTVIVMPIIAISTIVLRAVAITVAPSPILSEGA
jgi:hypothetical protein